MGLAAIRGWLSAAWARHKPGIETWHLLFKALGRAALGIALIWANPFDLFHKADEASSNLFQYYLAGHVLHPEPPRITVVLFTPSAFREINRRLEPDPPWAWPISFAYQAQVLENIAAYKPRAIFYDIEFYQERGSESAFGKALAGVTGAGDSKEDCHTRELDSVKGIPVLLAQPPAPQDILPQLCEAGTIATTVSWNGRPNIYPFEGYRDSPLICEDLHGPLENCAIDRDVKADLGKACKNVSVEDCLSKTPPAFLLREACEKGELSGERCFMATPAKLLFDMWCKDSGEKCFEPDHEDLINLVWRNPPTLVQSLNYSVLNPDEECGRPIANGPGHASSEAETAVTTCPAPYVVNADKIVMARTEQEKTALRAAFEGRVVMIGAEFPGMRDRVASPFYGVVPGIFAHVAALDNLNDLGASYIHARDDERLFAPARIGQFAIVTFCLFVIMYVIERLRKYAPSLAHLAHHQQPTRKHGLDAVIVLGCIAGLIVGVAGLLLGVSYLLFFRLHMAPLNWVGELALVWVFAFEETLYAILLVLLVFPLFSRRIRAFACHLLEKPETDHG